MPLPHLANGPESPLYKGPINRNQKVAAALGLAVAQVGLVLHAPASPRASTPVPGADLWREERPSPLSEFVDDPSPTPEDLAVETLSAEAALLSLARAITTLSPRQREDAHRPLRPRRPEARDATEPRRYARHLARRGAPAAVPRGGDADTMSRPVGFLAPRAVSALPHTQTPGFQNFGNVSDFRNLASRTRLRTLSAGSGDALAVYPLSWDWSLRARPGAEHVEDRLWILCVRPL